ncbi:MAG: VWA domain-containing protein [Fibrobacter sp.]|nr:VWA domain-containing protein [Fibrobacter sp.]
MTFAATDPYDLCRIQLKRERQPASESGRRQRARSENRSGRYARSRIPGDKKSNDIAFDATLRAAASYQAYRSKDGVALAISSQDIREKVREKKIGTTIVFVVDSSGSMGANQRMAATKGAILSLLLDAYQKRDRIAMVAFKGNEASVILPPTDSIELGKKSLETLPTGGKTPLVKGLAKGLELIKRERTGKRNRAFMLVISDGRANSGTDTDVNPFSAALAVCDEINTLGVQSVVIDTESGFIRLGKMRELADRLKGRYYPMEELRAERVTEVIYNERSKLSGN